MTLSTLEVLLPLTGPMCLQPFLLNMDIMDAKASVLNGPHGHGTVDPNQPGQYKLCEPT